MAGLREIQHEVYRTAICQLCIVNSYTNKRHSDNDSFTHEPAEVNTSTCTVQEIARENGTTGHVSMPLCRYVKVHKLLTTQ